MVYLFCNTVVSQRLPSKFLPEAHIEIAVNWL